MSKQTKVHVWEIECADQGCKKFFHILTDDNKRPKEGVLCVSCDIKERQKGVKYFEHRRDKFLAGFESSSLEYTERIEVIGE